MLGAAMFIRGLREITGSRSSSTSAGNKGRVEDPAVRRVALEWPRAGSAKYGSGRRLVALAARLHVRPGRTNRSDRG